MAAQEAVWRWAVIVFEPSGTQRYSSAFTVDKQKAGFGI